MICLISVHMIISVEATTIEITERPQMSIEGTVVQYICKTDSAFPYSPSILWYVDDTLGHGNDEYTVVNNLSHGEYHGTNTDSTLRFTTKRMINLKKVKCILGSDDKKFKEHFLNVKCKYLLVYIHKKVDLKGFHFCSKLLPKPIYVHFKQFM